MTEEKKPKKKIRLFDYIFESSIKSSKTIFQIVNELTLLTKNIHSLRDTILTLSNVIQVHQILIEELCKTIEQIVTQEKKPNSGFSLPLTNDTKKDKPN